MQFFGAILLQSSCSLEELKRYYKAYSTSEWNYRVEAQETAKINEIEHDNLAFEATVEQNHFFILYSWGNGVQPFCEFDLRGH